jgi:co-chaperonin GroES (HSP10)
MSIAMKMKNKYVLVKELPQETVTPGGIIIPEEKYNRKAIVITAPEDVDVKEGDTIIKTLGKGTMYTFGDEELEILHENHILAVIQENGTETTGT